MSTYGSGSRKSYREMRPPATVERARRFGMANQMAHESREKEEREAMRRKIGKAGRRKTTTRKPNPAANKGMNAGTLGGARGSLASALFGN